MMLASWYVALRHEFPTRLPANLLAERDRLLFCRWLILTGRMSDWFEPAIRPAITSGPSLTSPACESSERSTTCPATARRSG